MFVFTFLALSSFLLLICRHTHSLAAIAVAARPAELAPGRMVAPGLAFAVPGLELLLFVVPASGLGSLPAARLAQSS